MMWLVLVLLAFAVGLTVGTIIEHNNTRCPNNKNYNGGNPR